MACMRPCPILSAGASKLMVRGRPIRPPGRSPEELISVIHRQGFESIGQMCFRQLEPKGTLDVETIEP
jgi:hypothetical protein